MLLQVFEEGRGEAVLSPLQVLSSSREMPCDHLPAVDLRNAINFFSRILQVSRYDTRPGKVLKSFTGAL